MRSLKIFVAAFEERSFTLAAQRTGATQSGVSQHIRNIEERNGVKLFRRERGRVIPTPAAESFYRHALEALRAKDTAFLRLAQYSGGLTGAATIGLMPTVSAGALAPALITFGQRHPNARVHVIESYSASLIEQLMEGEIDVAIVPNAHEVNAGVRTSDFFETDETFVARLGHPQMAAALDRDGRLNLAKLGPIKLVLPEIANVRANVIRDFLDRQNVALEQVLEVNSMMATIDLVAQSDWCAVLPSLMMASSAYAGRFSVAKLEPSMDLKLVVAEPAGRGLSSVAEAFVEILRDSCVDLMKASPALTLSEF